MSESAPAETTFIRAGATNHFVDLSEIWRYRELLFFLAWRDIKVRYKQTVLGAAWAVLQPVAVMAIFTLFFQRAAGNEDYTVAYPLFVLTGLLPWFFFANSVGSSSNSVVSNQQLVTKVYFPRILVPISAVGAGLVDFAISLALLALVCLFYGVFPSVGILALPIIVVLLIVAVVGIGTLLSALTATYRDFRYIIPFMIQFWMFATPAIYLPASDAVMERWGPWLALNPVQGLILNFRAAALGLPFDFTALAISSAVTLGIAAVAGFYFRRVERSFADII